jgi:hypothetical protein
MTHDVELVVGDQADAGGATRDLFFVLGIVENCMVGGKETVLEALGVVASLEGLLVHYDVVDVLAGKEGNLVAAVSVKDAEKGLLVGGGLGLVGRGDEVKDSRVGVLHADAPALHGGDSVEELFILALVGRLEGHELVSERNGRGIRERGVGDDVRTPRMRVML